MTKLSRIAMTISSTFVAAAIVGGVSVPDASARRRCTSADFEGAWGYTLKGEVTQHIQIGPVAASGRFTADRNGTFAGSDTLSFNGTIVPRTFTGIATINPDCTGSVIVTIVQPANIFPPLNLSIVFVDNEQEFRFIETDPGTVITGTARKQ